MLSLPGQTIPIDGSITNDHAISKIDNSVDANNSKGGNNTINNSDSHAAVATSPKVESPLTIPRSESTGQIGEAAPNSIGNGGAGESESQSDIGAPCASPHMIGEAFVMSTRASLSVKVPVAETVSQPANQELRK